MAGEGTCPKCRYDRLKTFAEGRGLRVELRPSPKEGSQFGVNMYELKPGKVHGTWLGWFPAVPRQCMCRVLTPIVNRSGPGWEDE